MVARTSIVKRSWFLVALLTVFLGAGFAWAYPQPSIVPQSWELDYTFETPRVISVDLPGQQGRQLFMYMPYTVVNNTGGERLFIPDITVYTDQGHIIQAGQNVPSVVFEQVKQRLKNPLLESPIQIVGPLLQGEDNAKDGVAIWPVPDADIDAFQVFIGGLSGETEVVEDPITGENVLLRKTLMLEFRVPGDPAYITQTPITLDRQGWVMR